MTPTGTRVVQALAAVLIGYGAILLAYIRHLISLRSESAEDRSPLTVPPAGLSATPERGLDGDAGDPLETLTDGLRSPSSGRVGGAAGPFSVLAGDRSLPQSNGRGTSVAEPASGSREGLEDTSNPSHSRPSGDGSTARPPFSDPEAV